MTPVDGAVQPLPIEKWDRTLDYIMADMQSKPLNVHKLMAHNPQLLKAWWTFRNHSVDGGALGRRLGELVILRVSVHLKAWYEWGSHVDRAMRCGISLEEVDRVLVREIDNAWQSDEGALLRAVDELTISQRISACCRNELAKHFSVPQVLDIMAIQGMYVILGCMINTWGLALDEDVADRIAAHTSQARFAAAVMEFHGE